MTTHTLTRRPGLGQVLDALDAMLVDVVAGDPESAGPVAAVALFDPYDDVPVAPGSIVLGVGVRERRAIRRLVARLGEQGAAALVLRCVEVDDELRREAEAARLVLLSLAPSATWPQLFDTVSSTLVTLAAGTSDPFDVPTGDLFALAGAIRTLVDARVTVEDPAGRILAFSGRPAAADHPVPQRWTEEDGRRDAVRQLQRSDGPCYFPGLEAPRVGVAVRVDNELLGVIWAEVRERLAVEREELLMMSARVAAAHLLHLRAWAGADQQALSGLVTRALDGGPDAERAATQLGLRDDECVVVAVGVAPAGRESGHPGIGPAHRTADLLRVADAFALHLSVLRPGSVVARLQDTIYGLVPVGREDGAEERTRQVCSRFLDTLDIAGRVSIGIGGVAANTWDLGRSRTGADRALRVLRAGRSASRVAVVADVDVEALLLEMRDLAVATGRGPSGPFARLLAYDERKGGGSMVATLRAWLDAHGDIPAAAARIHVHENTFRYRLKRIGDIGAIDLGDADSRFALALQLRLFAIPAPR